MLDDRNSISINDSDYSVHYFKSLKSSCKLVNSAFCINEFLLIFSIKSDSFLNINQLIFVTKKLCVFFEVRTEVLNIIYSSFSFKRLLTGSLNLTI